MGICKCCSECSWCMCCMCICICIVCKRAAPAEEAPDEVEVMVAVAVAADWGCADEMELSGMVARDSDEARSDREDPDPEGGGDGGNTIMMADS
ncbi:hypothetical protein BCR44DRAFT_59953 [Catenaria anguillulae PL171]|uniref:Secreted protein n=1 Tax=Catenaria anguillulae PL171 TaxID=765915 RepID=A0A1Y2HWT2_9FUNG|nr:hypothetical protein BCR44DRAFT_59953 [Catenaria anguillulae PL171]